MNITYDRTIKIAGLSIVPWMRVGLERWFDNYKIIALEDLGANNTAHMPEVIVLAHDVTLAKKNAQNLVGTERFKQLADGPFADYYFLPYRPVTLPAWADSSRFLMADPKFLRTYENKAWLREKFSGTIPFAPFMTFGEHELEPTAQAYANLVEKFGGKLVLQEAQSTGGKGTHFVNDFETFVRTIGKLPDAGQVVVSAFVEGQERSVQCCATRFGVLVGGLQKQIIRKPQLTNLDLHPVHAFCGGEIGVVAESDTILAKIKSYVQTIGAAMYADGYRGIFGLDVLVAGDQVTILEVNARTTGLTPLLTMLSGERAVPFYLLHVLELGNFEYQITDMGAELPSPACVLLLHSQSPNPVRIGEALLTGVYRMSGGVPQLVRRDIRFDERDPADSFLVEMCVAPGTVVDPGSRMMNVFLRSHAMSDRDEFTKAVDGLIECLYAACAMSQSIAY